MRILRHYSDVPENLRGAVVAIGNFDGIHRGHQALIQKARRLAREFDAPLAVMTFEPHPRGFFVPNQPPFRLTSFRVKAKLIESLGVDVLFLLAFNESFASLSAEDFMREVLTKGLSARHVVIGDNFHFGNRRGGNPTTLEAFGRENGFGVTAMIRVTGPGEEPYSSTLVREYLKNGNPTRAGLLLGRYWEIEGRVQHGAKRGRELGFPTANVELGDMLRPAYGVYAVKVKIEDAEDAVWHSGVANLGIAPMFDYKVPLLETCIFDFDDDLYGRHVRVALVDYLRPEMKFDGLNPLIAQMNKDKERARATLSWESWEDEWPVSPFVASNSGES